MKGMTGRILHVDLTDRVITVEQPEEAFYRRYLGGSCLGAYYMLDRVAPGTDALGPDNIIVFSVGPATGAPVSGLSRHSVTSKSPLTGTICSSEAGGYWGPELKHAGYDAVVVSGRSSAPVYLSIVDGSYELKDAVSIWGMDTGDAQDEIRNELGDEKTRILQIGPAGENQVRYACIVNELAHFNGRGGLGAVMGSKNLKAIAVRGTIGFQASDRDALKEIARSAHGRIENDPFWTSLREYGTHVVVDAHLATGGLPTRNWNAAHCDGADELKAAEWRKRLITKPGTCWACVQQCKRTVADVDGLSPRFGGPEYETVGICGTNLGITDKLEICRINELCSRYTLDTISFGGTVALAMECFEKGIISTSDTGGLDLSFGNHEAVKSLVGMTAQRLGFGDLIALGSKRLSEKWGPAATALAVHTKGREFPAHMPRLKGSMALAYACSPFGADHCSSEHDGAIAAEPISEMVASMGLYTSQEPSALTPEKAKLFWFTQRAYSLMDTCCACAMAISFSTVYKFPDLVAMIEAATGWTTNLHELLLAGERRLHMFRLFNSREGMVAQDDVLPPKMFADLDDSRVPRKNRTVDEPDFEESRAFYYQLAGWDEVSGSPSDVKLRELGLERFISSGTSRA